MSAMIRGLLILALLFGLVPALCDFLSAHGLVERTEGASTNSSILSFGQLLCQFCILRDTQSTSKTNTIGCIVICGVSALMIALIIFSIIVLCLCLWRTRCKSKTDTSEHTKGDGTQTVEEEFPVEEEKSGNRLLRRFIERLKRKKVKKVKREHGQSYERLQQDEKMEDEEEVGGPPLVEVEFIDIKKEEPEGKEIRDSARMKQERSERARATMSRSLFKNKFRYFKHCCDLGSRLQKYWFLRGEKKLVWSAMQFTAKRSKKCQFSLDDQATMASLNGLFRDLQHPHLLQVHNLGAKEEYVSVVQKFIPEGSLRDRIYQVDPTKDWSEKYTMAASIQTLDARQVATCCRHILEALLALYEVGFLPTGQVHTGNVFFEDGRYILGGFENTLLGYRTSQYAEIKNEGLLDSIDIIMLGHLVYEVSSGIYLSEICPSKDFDFEKIADANVQNFLKFIFCVDAKKSHKKAVTQILRHSFIKDIQVTQTPPLEITQQAKRLLEVIRNPESTELTHASLGDPGLDIIQLTKESADDYVDRTRLERIGWRSEKVWAIAKHGRWGEVLLSAAVVPCTCPIFVQTDMETIKEIVDVVEPHPHIHSILEICYVKESGRHITVSVELLRKESIKDFLYKCNPRDKWESKYKKVQHPFNAHQIARYGAQVLDALLFLYSLGFPPIGQVTTGNIFIDGEDCLLGGFENVMLGHRTESHTSMRNIAGQFIDVFMFGLVVLEMATGKTVKSLPAKQDYKQQPKELREVLDFIFELNSSVQDVRSQAFFLEYKMDSHDQTPSLSRNARVLLQKVKRGKWRNQDDSGGKVKDKLKTHAFRKWGHH